LDKDNSKTFTEALLPMMVVEHRALLCITTAPEGKAGGYHEIFKIRDDYNTPVFKYYEIRTVCRPCYAKGIRLKCKHFADRVPQHHSEERVSKIKKIMEAVGRGSTYERETAGVTTAVDDRCFGAKHVNMAFRTPYRPPEHHEYQFVNIAVDPNSGPIKREDSPTTSDFAIVTTYMDLRGNIVVFGTTAFVCTDPDFYPYHIRTHVQKVRNAPHLRNATIIATIECKTGFEDKHIARAFESTRDPKIVFMDEAELKIGIPTTHGIKREMAMELRHRLKDGRLRFDAAMFTTSPNMTPAQDLDKLRKQLLDYKEQMQPSKNPFKPAVAIYSGKPHKDDMAVALQLNCKYFGHFLQDDKYAQFRED
jgi:hypothetical protein